MGVQKWQFVFHNWVLGLLGVFEHCLGEILTSFPRIFPGSLIAESQCVFFTVRKKKEEAKDKIEATKKSLSGGKNQ